MTARRPVMVLGCTSTAGKSLLATALCRWFARRGVDVAPFKAQNMSNNARVVDGGEIGVAQWLQARAAGVEPSVDMNPVLLKPEADTRSQVVLAGRSRPDLTAMPWRERAPHLWPAMSEAFDRLQARYELVVIEGAGSPAEINLPDQVNNRICAHADASALLVVDIDRGGAFAHLVGTWTLVPDSTKDRLAGFVLNKFRGDAGLLAPGPAIVTERTSMADVGVLPMLDHQLPDEEGATVKAVPPRGAPTVAVVRYPYGSNLDEWHVLPHAAHVRWATTPSDLDGVDLVILPGSKHVAADADWLRRRRLDHAVRRAAGRGTRVLGVCGGAMLLGTEVTDPHGVEGATAGLGLLPISTEMAATKTTRPVRVSVSELTGPWAALGGARADGYEIRHGEVTPQRAGVEVAPLVWADGPVLATTVHGLAENPDVVRRLTGLTPPPVLEQTFERLADAVEEHLDTELLDRLVRR
ncbi:MAG: cobyric acid synthase [Actinomycetota bacterium]